MWSTDARDYQILFLSLFLALGIGTKDWTLRPSVIGVAISTCLIVQGLAALLKFQHQLSTLKPTDQVLGSEQTDRPFFNLGWRSALITGLGLSLLLRTDHCTTMALAATLAILSKFCLQVKGKHFFNPANFGIIAVLILTEDAWVSPGQWGTAGWFGLVFAGAGGLVLHRVGRWDTSVMFLGSYGLCLGLRDLWLGWTWDVWFHSLSSGSLLLFALFMLTDPRSIPDARISRLLWSSAIAIVSFILQTQFFLPTSLFWALFFLAPLSIALDQLWTIPRFTWGKEQPADLTSSSSLASEA
ncbi:MAG: Na+-transporting NADH:ubiquinone oxidoreductase, subunit NqrB [Acaryochloridaceae cyanobacterium SU_2_1]|nr:Na+-transporting NADH:ubiquinone oxidoreductase, subunit NqrB [Acaryochloridaceae cyanobacterium SU_2_1]